MPPHVRSAWLIDARAHVESVRPRSEHVESARAGSSFGRWLCARCGADVQDCGCMVGAVNNVAGTALAHLALAIERLAS